MNPDKEDFLEALLALLKKHKTVIDHNHDAEALDDGWRFQGNGFRADMVEIYRLQEAGR